MQVGIDTIELFRLEEVAGNNNKLEKMFTKNEIDYFNKFSNKLERIAGFFCAKESFAKALKSGIGKNFSLLDIEILHENSGAPYVNIINKSLKERLAGKEIELSISHSSTLAMAICIIC